MTNVEIMNFVMNALLLILLIGLSRESLGRIRNIIDILSNGAYKNCPFFQSRMKGGRREYDPEGGDTDERHDSSSG